MSIALEALRCVCGKSSARQGSVPCRRAIVSARAGRSTVRRLPGAGASPLGCRDALVGRASKRTARTVTAASVEPVASVQISVEKEVPFGQSVKVVGGHSSLGDWNLDSALSMEWSEGNIWKADVDLPPGEWEFKCVIVGGNQPYWEEGDNRVAEVPELTDKAIAVECQWGNTAMVTLSFEEPTRDKPEEAPVEDSGEAEAVITEKAPAESPPLEETPMSEALPEAQEPVASTPESNSPPDSTAEPAAGGLTPEEASTSSPKVPQASAGTPAPKAPVPEAPAAEDATESSATPSKQGSPASVDEKEEAEISAAAAWLAIVMGIAAIPVVGWSEYTLFSTGCGLPPGPSGLLGGAEGVSYVVILGVIVWSAGTKVSTGKGLPSGPSGLLGAVEGLSYLATMAGLGVLILQYLNYGFVPALKPDVCFADYPIEPLDVAALVESVQIQLAQLTEATKEATKDITMPAVEMPAIDTEGLTRSMTDSLQSAQQAAQKVVSSVASSAQQATSAAQQAAQQAAKKATSS